MDNFMQLFQSFGQILFASVFVYFGVTIHYDKNKDGSNNLMQPINALLIVLAIKILF